MKSASSISLTTTPLTDLPNRAALNLRLSARRSKTPRKTATSLPSLCIDLDRFKEVNDLYGHAAGDSVLLEITRLMKKGLWGCVPGPYRRR